MWEIGFLGKGAPTLVRVFIEVGIGGLKGKIFSFPILEGSHPEMWGPSDDFRLPGPWQVNSPHGKKSGARNFKGGWVIKAV